MDGSLMTVASWIEATDDDVQEGIPVHGTTIQANQIEQPTPTDTHEHLQHPHQQQPTSSTYCKSYQQASTDTYRQGVTRMAKNKF
jgi:hypothetical protein